MGINVSFTLICDFSSQFEERKMRESGEEKIIEERREVKKKEGKVISKRKKEEERKYINKKRRSKLKERAPTNRKIARHLLTDARGFLLNLTQAV